MKTSRPLNKIFKLTFLSTFFILVSCVTSTPVVETTANPAVTHILDEEINRFENAGVIHIESTYYNPHIKGFLTAYNNGDRMATEQLRNVLTTAEINKILNIDELEYLIAQLNEPAKLPITPAMTSHKVILEDLHSRGEKNIRNNQRLLNIEKDRMIISTPIFTRDKEFALVDVSKGKLHSMYTTINLYQKTDGKYVFYKTLLGYME